MSKNFEKVKRYYGAGLWSLGMTRNAIGRWITAEEFTEITGQAAETEKG